MCMCVSYPPFPSLSRVHIAFVHNAMRIKSNVLASATARRNCISFVCKHLENLRAHERDARARNKTIISFSSRARRNINDVQSTMWGRRGVLRARCRRLRRLRTQSLRKHFQCLRLHTLHVCVCVCVHAMWQLFYAAVCISSLQYSWLAEYDGGRCAI